MGETNGAEGNIRLRKFSFFSEKKVENWEAVMGLGEAEKREQRRDFNVVHSDPEERDEEESLELLGLFYSVRGQ